MAKIRWKLFGVDIYEDTSSRYQEKHDSNTKQEVPKASEYDERSSKEHRENEDINDEDIVNSENTEGSISDIVRNAFYTSSLKDIYDYNDLNKNERREDGEQEKEQDKEEFEQYIYRLNKIDEILKLFFDSSKNILGNLNKEFDNIQGEDNRQLQTAVYNYANAVYEGINNRDGNIDRFQDMQRRIHEMLPEDTYEILEQYFVEINSSIEMCMTEDRHEEYRRIRNSVYVKVRQLPKYLGSPYVERYKLYSKIQKYPKMAHVMPKRQIASNNNSASVVYMLVNQTSFDDYFDKKYELIIQYIQNLQERTCDVETIINGDKFNNIIYELNDLISKSEIREPYLGKDGDDFGKKGRCFAIIDLHFDNGNIEEYLCFSGNFDSVDNNIKSKFGEIPEYNVAISEIVNSGKFINPILAITNGDIKYYFDKGMKSINLQQLCAAVDLGYKKLGRMFSCCERKFYSYLEKHTASTIKEYRMFTKYNACEMCVDAIADFNSKSYRGSIICGVKKSNSVNDKVEYDKLAGRVEKGDLNIKY